MIALSREINTINPLEKGTSMKKLAFFPLCLLGFLTVILAWEKPVLADATITLPNSFTAQSYFHDLSHDLGIITAYVPLEPAAPMGILGFDVGVEASMASINASAPYWALATNNSAPGTVVVPRLHVQKGLPGNLDIGFSYASVPGSNISLMGGELKFALLAGSVVTPAVSLRGAYTKLNGVSDIDLSSYSVDLSISKGFGPLTPFAGVQELFVNSKATNAALGLTAESINNFRGFLGAKLSLAVVNFVAEADLGDLPVYSLRFNVGW